MAVNAITSAAEQAAPQLRTLPSFIQIILQGAGVNVPDNLFNMVSRAVSDPPGLAAAPYINALSNLSVRRVPHYIYKHMSC